MINSPLYILDNTGCYFYSENDYFVIDYALSGYVGFNKTHIGQNISYLCKSRNGYEIGLGQIDAINDKIILKRIRVLLSSDNNNSITFGKDASNALYSFANSYNFRTGFNNLIEKNNDFIADNTMSTYLVDISKQDIKVKLPDPVHNQSLVLEFKTSSGNHNLYINCKDDINISILSSNNYSRFISTGKEWLELTNNPAISLSAASLNDSGFNILSSPAAGPSGSLQYNDGINIAGSNIYYNSSTKKTLFGSNNASIANIVLPTSGSDPIVFNQNKSASDFIVNGSGDKSLYFGYDGRLGINMPVGSRPQTALHVINNNCQPGIRLENRNQCVPTNLTLYHKPSTAINNNSLIGTINLSAKNSAGAEVEYSQLRSRAMSYVAASSSGEFSIAVNKNNVLIESIITNPDYTLIKGSNNSIHISSSGINLEGPVQLSSLKWGSPITSGLFLATDNNNNLVLTPIANTPIIGLLDGEVIAFSGACT
jgi:hypothetical protein